MKEDAFNGAAASDESNDKQVALCKKRAAVVDAHIIVLNDESLTHDEAWCNEVLSIPGSIGENVLPYLSELSTYEKLLEEAKRILANLQEGEEISKTDWGEIERIRSEKQRREAEKEAAERARIRAEEEERQKQELRRKKITTTNRVVILITLALLIGGIVAHAVVTRSFDVWCICGTIMVGYIALCTLLKLNKKKKYPTGLIVTVNILSLIACIPLLCISPTTKVCAFLIPLGIFIAYLLLQLQAYLIVAEDSNEEFYTLGIFSEMSGYFAVLGLAVCLFSGTNSFIVIGIGFVLLTVIHWVLAVKLAYCRQDSSGKDIVDDDWSSYSFLKTCAFLLAGIAFFITGFFVDGFAILSLCAFLCAMAGWCSSAYYDRSTWIVALLGLVGVGLSFIPMFV